MTENTASKFRGATVEIVDPTPGDVGVGVLTPSRVIVNGTDVGLIERDGVRVEDIGDTAATKVTLVLLPSRIVIRHEDQP